LKTKRTIFFHVAHNARRIVCLALSANHKHLAVCESMSLDERDFQGKAQVSIFHLAARKRVRTLSLPARADFAAVCFSNDGKHIFTQCDSPDNGMAYWKWEVSSILEEQYTKMHQSERQLSYISVALCRFKILPVSCFLASAT
jgi:hypothetical protein